MEDLDSLDKFTLLHIGREIGANVVMSDSKDAIIDAIIETKNQLQHQKEESLPEKVNFLLPDAVIRHITESVLTLKGMKVKLQAHIQQFSPDSLVKVCQLLGYTMEVRGKFCLMDNLAIDSAKTLINYLLFMDKEQKEPKSNGLGILVEAAKAIHEFRILKSRLIAEMEDLSTDVIVETARNLDYKVTSKGNLVYINGEPIDDIRTLVLMLSG
jgi:hypothetical protein